MESLAVILELLKAVRAQTIQQNEYLKEQVSKLEENGPKKVYDTTLAQVEIGTKARSLVDKSLGNLQRLYNTEIKKHSDLEKENKKLEEGIRKMEENIKLKAQGRLKLPTPPPEEAEGEIAQGENPQGEKAPGNRRPKRRKRQKGVVLAQASQPDS